MRIGVRLADSSFELDLSHPIDLAQPIGFELSPSAAIQAFGAPAPRAETFRTGNFLGDVAHGGSCNCRTITLTPHTSGTHTEGIGHLTRDALDTWRIVPTELLPCVLLTITVADGGVETGITSAALERAWPDALAFAPLAAVIRTMGPGEKLDLLDPPYFASDAMELLVRRGIMHLVVDLPSLDPRDDRGKLSAHRAFFGLPTDSTCANEAHRPRATVTELAVIPAHLTPGSYLLALQVPAIAGDAVPSRPLLYAIASGPAR